jgi:hypothetical protein
MMTPLEINHLGYKALTDTLGFDGMKTLMQQIGEAIPRDQTCPSPTRLEP